MSGADYVVVGGGTTGALLATRLSEDPGTSVILVEAGPSDEHEDRARTLRRWDEMVESEYDLDYRSVPQVRGNSEIRQTRSRILGGCSTTNTMIAWTPLASDLQDWVARGAVGWGPDEILPYRERLLTPIQPVADADRNPYVSDVVEAASAALDLPLKPSGWDDGALNADARGAGFFDVGYAPETNLRSSTSIHYLHPALAQRSNLSLITDVVVTRIVFDEAGGDPDSAPRAVGVQLADGRVLSAEREVLVCAGAIDSPALLQRSGVGPVPVLRAAGVDVVADLPGVGENLQDHAEGLVVWEATRAVPSTRASGWDAGAMLTLGDTPGAPDVLMHFPVEAWAVHPENHGYSFPEQIVSIAPNVAKPSSRGRVWITSPDPAVAPCIDYRYFTDAEGHDESMLLAGVRAARCIAEAEPMASWVGRELFPGVDVVTDEELSEVERANHQTVYHVSCTCKMGSDADPMAVLDPQLRVRGVSGLRVVDASAMPTLTATNPVVTIMMLAERAADLIRG
ncbi:MAG: GMC family oxidoreductase [Galactobacter sp.]